MAKTKNNNNNQWMIAVGVIAVILIFGGQQGWFKSVYYGSGGFVTTLNPSNTIIEYSSYTNNLWFNPNTVCINEETTGYIDTNIPLGTCAVFMKKDNVWQPIDAINLNNAGDYSDKQTTNVAGVAFFKAICCDSSNNCKVSNEAALTVQNCAQPPQPNQASCTDTDGGVKEFVAGTVVTKANPNDIGISYSDNCKNLGSLNEFYCDLGVVEMGVIPCAGGCNGGACQQVQTCTDTDGGQDDQFMVYGTCESSVTQSGTWDQCSNGQLVETYCAADKTCQTTTVGCGAEQVCYNGKCVIANSICDYGCQVAGYNSDLCVNFNINGAVSMDQTCANNNGVFANVYNACAAGQICCCRN